MSLLISSSINFRVVGSRLTSAIAIALFPQLFKRMRRYLWSLRVRVNPS
jgi:hypothetical protein